MEIKKLLWNKNIDVVKIDGRWFALNGWNGEAYLHCWETNENTFALDDNQEYKIKPIYEGVGEPDADGDYESYEVVDYEIM